MPQGVFFISRSIIEPTQVDLGAFLYEENPDLIKFR